MPKFDFSEGLDRLSAAMTTGAAEVPFIAQMHEFAMRESGIPGHEFYTDAKKFVHGIAEVSQRFGFDTPGFCWDVYNIEAQALGCTLVTFEDMAPAIGNTSALVKNEKDLAKLKAPDPYSSARMPMVFEIMQETRAQAGMKPLPCFCAPFTLASHILTFENLIVQIREKPAFVHKVMTFLVDEVLAPYVNALCREFPDATVIEGSDAVASLPFITQAMLDEFALTYIERLQAQAIRPVICDNWWGDAYAEDLPGFWDRKLRATPDYLKIQDPDLFKIGVEPVVDYARRNDVPVVLGVDNNVFQNGPEDEIRMRIHEYMEAVEAVGKGAVYLCSLSAVTPAENVATAIAAVKQFRAGQRPWADLHRAGASPPSHETEPAIANSGPARQSAADGDATETEVLLDGIFEAVLDQQDQTVIELVTQGLARDADVLQILNEGLIAAMDEVGEEFADGRIFVPEMLMAARAMKAGLEIIRPILTKTGARAKGIAMLATVQGDVHDIGKNLVGMMLEGAGYEVVDLGVNKTPREVLDAATELRPDVVGLSALLTTSMPSMEKTVALFKKVNAGIPVVVGGAPVTREYANAIQADGYGENAPHAVETVHAIVAKTRTALEQAG